MLSSPGRVTAGDLESEMLRTVPTTSDPGHPTSFASLRTSGCGACALSHTRSPWSPASICGALAAARNYSATAPPPSSPSPPPPPTLTPAVPRPLSQGANARGGVSPRPPFLLLPTGPPPPGLPRPLAASPSPCPRTCTLPNTMGERWEGAAGTRQVSSACRQSGSSVTRSPLLLPPRPR